MPLDDTEIIAGQQDADESGDYGFLAFKMASAAAAELAQLTQVLNEASKLARALANMTVEPGGALYVGEDQSTLQLPEQQEANQGSGTNFDT